MRTIITAAAIAAAIITLPIIFGCWLLNRLQPPHRLPALPTSDVAGLLETRAEVFRRRQREGLSERAIAARLRTTRHQVRVALA